MKLLFFDIDGTILGPDRKIPPSVASAMDAAHRRGHLLFINTGRTYCNRERLLDGYPLDGWVMGCGARIIYHEETLQSHEYPLRDSLRLRDLLRDLRLPALYECDTGMYFDPDGPDHPAFERYQYYSKLRGTHRLIREDDPEFRVVKLFCFSEARGPVAELERRATEMGMPYTAIDVGRTAWEVVQAGCSKGTGMAFLRERFGAKPEDCYAFGDSANDLPMLREAGYSVAMGNAPEEVKRVCSYVTDLPERDGIEKAMIHFGLI